MTEPLDGVGTGVPAGVVGSGVNGPVVGVLELAQKTGASAGLRQC